MKVSVTCVINAAHQLPGTELHGHTYRVTVIYDGQKDPLSGQVFGFGLLREELQSALNHCDHHRLEQFIGVLPATAENLATSVARSLCKKLGRLVNVRVQTGEDGWAETEMYQREDGEYFSR